MSTGRQEHLRGIAMTTLGVLILTPDSLLIRLIGTDTWTLLFWRGGLQALAIMGYYLVRRGRGVVGVFRGMGWVGVAVALLYTGSNILFIQSIRLTFVANTLIILASAPLLGAVFSWFFLRERVKVRTWVATVAGLAGVAVLFSGSMQGGHAAGDLCAMGAAAFLAAAFVAVRGVKGVSMVPAVALTGLFTALLAAPLADPWPLARVDAALLLLLGAFISPVSFALITLGPRHLPAPEVSLIMLLETVLGPLWVWLVIAEAPPAGTLLGGTVVLGTLCLHSVLGLREDQASSSV